MSKAGGIIHLLPDAVANQIAAGEVIQRPASVVKELVENAVDAGATSVQVYVVDAGKTSIQVVDNGQGMSETDARLAFERHATSKIREVADLYALHTMGFRGEALPSIVAVAQVELRTRTADEELGVCLTIEGSKITGQDPVACPVGANFLVKNLFFNVPARRKFLKSNQTELGNISTEFERLALAHPDVAMQLYSNDVCLLNLPAGKFKQRILGVFGRKLDQSLIPVQVDTSLVKLSGYVGSPESARKKGAQQFFFVNDRFMRHPYFAKAVQSAFERLIPENETVPYFIRLTVDPSRIDVNIHPTKTEIKFEDDHEIWQIILAAVREALGRYNALPTIDFDTANRPDIPAFQDNKDIAPPSLHIDRSFNPFRASGGGSYGAGRLPARSDDWRTVYDALTRSEAASGSETVEPSEEEQTLYTHLSQAEQAEWEKSAFSEFFQYKGRYILIAVKSGLMLVDQHRAHVRVLYETYRRQLEQRHGLSQGVLFPQTIQLSLSQVSLLERISDDLVVVGFDLSPLGGGSYAINGVPAGTEGLNPTALLQDMLDAAETKAAEVGSDIYHAIAFALARRVALPVGQALDAKEMEALIEKLFACATPNYTPDGKPTLVILSQEKIEKLFD